MSATQTIRLFDPSNAGKPGTWTVRQIVEGYLGEKRKLLEAGVFAAKSLEKVTRYLGSYCEMYGSLKTDNCKRSDILDWIIEHPEWEATITRQDAIGSVVSCLRWANDEFGLDIAYKRPRYAGPPIQPRPAITLQEYRAMRKHSRRAKTRRGRDARTRTVFRAMLAFLWYTGCRTHEARELTWDEIDWIRNVAVQTHGKTVQVTGEPRTIPIKKVRKLLRWLQQRRRRGQRTVFTNSLGKPWTCDRFAKEFRRYARLAGVREEVSAYCLRHGLCSRLIEAGATERQVADVLGHKSTRFVAWYAKSTRSAADHLNATLDLDRKNSS